MMMTRMMHLQRFSLLMMRMPLINNINKRNFSLPVVSNQRLMWNIKNDSNHSGVLKMMMNNGIIINNNINNSSSGRNLQQQFSSASSSSFLKSSKASDDSHPDFQLTTKKIKVNEVQKKEGEEVPVPVQQQHDEETVRRIQNFIKNSKVVVFMKGPAEMPACGFSRAVVQVLDALEVDFYGYNILADPVIREELRTFSNWPTFPQIYINGQFIGGCDIFLEMYRTGELHKALHDAGITPKFPPPSQKK